MLIKDIPNLKSLSETEIAKRVQDLAIHKTTEYKVAERRYNEAYDLYDGNHWGDESFISAGGVNGAFSGLFANYSTPVGNAIWSGQGENTDYRTKNARLTSNKFETFTDILSSKLFGSKFEVGVKFQPKEFTDDGVNLANNLEKFVSDRYFDLNMQSVLKHEATSFLVGANSVLYFPWDNVNKRFRLYPINFNQSRMFFDDPVRRNIIAGLHFNRIDDTEAKRLTNKPDATVGKFIEYWDSDWWIQVFEDAIIAMIPNPYCKRFPTQCIPYYLTPLSPVQNNNYGRTIARGFNNLQVEYNMRFSDLSNMIRNNIYPTTILEGTGLDAKQFDAGPFGVNEINQGGRVYILEKEVFVKEVTDYLEFVDNNMQQKAGINEAVLGKEKAVPQSGVALALKFEILTAKIESWRVHWNLTLSDINERIVKYHEAFDKGSIDSGKFYKNMPKFAPPLPQDLTVEIENAKMLIDSQLSSRRTAADDLGIEESQREFDQVLKEDKQISNIEEPSNGPEEN